MSRRGANRCINCSLLIPRNLRRHSLEQASTSIINLLQSWITPSQLSSESVLCTECLTVLQDRANTINEETALPLPAFGHRRVCLPCGNSILRATRTYPARQDRQERNILMRHVPLHLNQDTPSSGNEIKVFCPKCNTEVPHTAEGIQEDQTKIVIAKVYHYFEHEYEELKKMYPGVDLTPLSSFQQRTALAIGVSETTVLEVLKEEEGRLADNRQKQPEKGRRARKRARQPVSSSEDDSSDDNVDDGGDSSFIELAQREPEIETLVVKIEPPEYYREQPLTDPISLEVKAEPPDDDENDTNETLALNEPTGTKSIGRKIPRRSDVTSTQQHTQGESSTTVTSSNLRLTEELDESGLFGENEIKLENIEIGEEGFS